MMFIVFLLLITSIVGSDFILTVDEKSPIDQAIFRFPSSSDLLKNFHSTFALTNNQTELILTRTIDRDHWCAQGICSCEKCSFVLEFVSTDSRQAKFFTLNITVNDINDHTCQFLDVQQRISLSESIQVGHRFPLARAIDEDGGINGQLTFELLPNDDGHFQLDVVNLSSNEYAIYALVKRRFDREMLERYQLVLQGRDHAVPQPRSNRINLTIEILDENDNAPKFNQTEYSIQSLPENTPIGSQLLRVSASDADQGLNGLIHYSIVNPSSNSSTFPFLINSNTGVISLRSSLDYETTRSYRFLIRAADSGLPQSLSTDTWLSISIEDVNDCPVEILFIPHRRFQYDNQTLAIEENLPVDNLTLGYIRLSDQDSLARNLSLTLSVDQTTQEYELFMSNQVDSYVLRVRRGTFDRETQSEVNLHFIASDGLLISTFDLKIHLLDLNDNPSEFPSNPLRFVLDELANYQMTDHPIEDYQYTIGYLNATDRDEGVNAVSRYELEANPLVKVDADTGRLYLTQPIDRERLSRIHLKGKAVNVAEPKWSSEVQIEIDVLDVNDNIPRCSNTSYRVTIPENSSIDKPLIKINATDNDNGLNGTIVYSFRTNSTWPFAINDSTGEIYSKSPFDYESDWKAFSLIIDLKDRGEPISHEMVNACLVEIVVEDINDNRPELNDDRQREIFLDRRMSQQQIIPLNITDRDAGENGRMTFTLQAVESNLPLNATDGFFRMHSNGSLQIIRPVEAISLFKLQIVVEDHGSPSQTNFISISVAVGDRTNPAYSSFEKIQQLFEEQQSQTNQFAFLFGLTLLILTFICLISMLISCLLIRQHHRRRQTALIARKQLLCVSTQQLTTSDSTTSSLEHQQTLFQPPSWNTRASIDRYSSGQSHSPASHTYKILHVPVQYEKDRSDQLSCDHGYHGSTQTRSPSSTSTEALSSQPSMRRDSLVNQLPYFVIKCKTLSAGDTMIEMNVDGSDEDAH